MPITWYRDLTIIIFGLVATLVLIFSAILWYLFWKRTATILENVDKTTKIMEEISSRIASPLSRMIGIFQLVAGIVDIISSLFKKQGGKHGD